MKNVSEERKSHLVERSSSQSFPRSKQKSSFGKPLVWCWSSTSDRVPTLFEILFWVKGKNVGHESIFSRLDHFWVFRLASVSIFLFSALVDRGTTEINACCHQRRLIFQAHPRGLSINKRFFPSTPLIFFLNSFIIYKTSFSVWPNLQHQCL